MRVKIPALVAALVLAVGGLAACGGGSDDEGATGATQITIGSFGFSESETLAQVYGGALRKAGAQVTYRLKLGSREVVAPALESGQVDLVPEYVGNYLAFLDKGQTSGLPVDQAVSKTRELAAGKGITVPEASRATDGDVIAVTKDFAKANGLRTISDLAKVGGGVTLAGPSECETRQTCLLGLRSTYGLQVRFTSTGTDAGGPVTKAALDQGRAQVGRLFSSDPDLGEDGKYVVLQDDKSFQQAGNVIPVIRTDKATPAVVEVLNKVSRALTDEKLIEMNTKTDVDKEDPAAVAAAFLSENGL